MHFAPSNLGPEGSMKEPFSLERISAACLSIAFGGYRLTALDRESTNTQSAYPWSANEDGTISGPRGEWTWDSTINQDQPPRLYSGTEDGFLFQGGRLYQDDSINSGIRADEAERALVNDPDYRELADYNRDALNFNLSPTEDGFQVNGDGRVYVDRSINEGLAAPLPDYGPGDYVPWEQNDPGPNQRPTPTMGSTPEPAPATFGDDAVD